MATVLVVVVSAAVSLRLFVYPTAAATAPARADAIVVLSGDRGERMAEAIRLIDRGVAPTLVHAGTPDSDFVRALCSDQTQFAAVCLSPEPDNTRTEAGAVARLASQRGWDQIAIVTSTYHVTRAALLIGRCSDADLRMVAARPEIAWWRWVAQVAHEWGGLVQALALRRDC